MNFSLKEIERRQERISSIASKKRYRRSEIIKYIRGIVIMLCIGLFCVKVFWWVDHMITGFQRIEQSDLLTVGSRSSIYDSHGELLQTIDTFDFSQQYVSIEHIPDAVQKAFVASEDKIFYKHHGVNARGVLEDVYARLTSQESMPNMRYTITQQLIKNQLAKHTTSNSFIERLKNTMEEQYTAIMLEDDLSKDRILEYYLNTINLGDDMVGVGAASVHYFGKEVLNLTVSEAAVLAAVAKNPSGLNPLEHSDANGVERRSVLKSMLDQKYISEDEYGDALGDDVYLRIRNNVIGKENEQTGRTQVNSYYVDAVLEQVAADLQKQLGYSATESYRMIYGKGLKIYTCMDRSIQNICDDVINNEKYYPVPKSKKKEKKHKPLKEVDEEEKPQASFVLLEQKTGAVRALVGGRGEKKTNHGLDRAISLERQPGTLFDVLSVYAPALDTAGMTLGTVQDDSEYQYPDSDTTVSNLDHETYLGFTTIRDALTLSKAVPAVKTLEKISVQVGYSYLQRFGLTTLVEKKRGNSTETFGTSESKNDLQLKMGLGQLTDGVTNLEMTSAYAAFGNAGMYRTAKFYTKVLDRNGKVLLKKKSTKMQIMKKSTAWLLTDAMSSAPLQLEKNLIDQTEGIAVSGKSGRTEENTDVWYLGYTPYYTFGIWAGNDEGTPLKSTVYVTTMWKDIMKQVHKYKNVKKASFQKPEDIVSCRICTKCGNLAVSGLCDRAEGGSTVRSEYFEKGTEPVKKCTCHAKYRFCKESKQLATEACPEESCYERVLLVKKETGETEDSSVVFGKYSDGSLCRLHH